MLWSACGSVHDQLDLTSDTAWDHIPLEIETLVISFFGLGVSFRFQILYFSLSLKYITRRLQKFLRPSQIIFTVFALRGMQIYGSQSNYEICVVYIVLNRSWS